MAPGLGMNPANLLFPMLLIIVFVASSLGFHPKSFLHPVSPRDIMKEKVFYFTVNSVLWYRAPKLFYELTLNSDSRGSKIILFLKIRCFKIRSQRLNFATRNTSSFII